MPPGQYDIGDEWPVLTAEATPRLGTESCNVFVVEGLVEQPRTWTWDEIHELPSSTYFGAFDRVTTWSKHNVTFSGVSVTWYSTPRARCRTHPLVFVTPGTRRIFPSKTWPTVGAWIGVEYEGKPLPVEHGGPAGLFVPHLDFWKSAKWVAGLRLLDHACSSVFWEQYGYHNHGDPWRERYRGD